MGNSQDRSQHQSVHAEQRQHESIECRYHNPHSMCRDFIPRRKYYQGAYSLNDPCGLELLRTFGGDLSSCSTLPPHFTYPHLDDCSLTTYSFDPCVTNNGTHIFNPQTNTLRGYEPFNPFNPYLNLSDSKEQLEPLDSPSLNSTVEQNGDEPSGIVSGSVSTPQEIAAPCKSNSGPYAELETTPANNPLVSTNIPSKFENDPSKPKKENIERPPASQEPLDSYNARNEPKRKSSDKSVPRSPSNLKTGVPRGHEPHNPFKPSSVNSGTDRDNRPSTTRNNGLPTDSVEIPVAKVRPLRNSPTTVENPGIDPQPPVTGTVPSSRDPKDNKRMNEPNWIPAKELESPTIDHPKKIDKPVNGSSNGKINTPTFEQLKLDPSLIYGEISPPHDTFNSPLNNIVEQNKDAPSTPPETFVPFKSNSPQSGEPETTPAKHAVKPFINTNIPSKSENPSEPKNEYIEGPALPQEPSDRNEQVPTSPEENPKRLQPKVGIVAPMMSQPETTKQKYSDPSRPTNSRDNPARKRPSENEQTVVLPDTPPTEESEQLHLTNPMQSSSAHPNSLSNQNTPQTKKNVAEPSQPSSPKEKLSTNDPSNKQRTSFPQETPLSNKSEQPEPVFSHPSTPFSPHPDPLSNRDTFQNKKNSVEPSRLIFEPPSTPPEIPSSLKSTGEPQSEEIKTEILANFFINTDIATKSQNDPSKNGRKYVEQPSLPQEPSKSDRIKNDLNRESSDTSVPRSPSIDQRTSIPRGHEPYNPFKPKNSVDASTDNDNRPSSTKNSSVQIDSVEIPVSKMPPFDSPNTFENANVGTEPQPPVTPTTIESKPSLPSSANNKDNRKVNEPNLIPSEELETPVIGHPNKIDRPLNGKQVQKSPSVNLKTSVPRGHEPYNSFNPTKNVDISTDNDNRPSTTRNSEPRIDTPLVSPEPEESPKRHPHKLEIVAPMTSQPETIQPNSEPNRPSSPKEKLVTPDPGKQIVSFPEAPTTNESELPGVFSHPRVSPTSPIRTSLNHEGMPENKRNAVEPSTTILESPPIPRDISATLKSNQHQQQSEQPKPLFSHPMTSISSNPDLFLNRGTPQKQKKLAEPPGIILKSSPTLPDTFSPLKSNGTPRPPSGDPLAQPHPVISRPIHPICSSTEQSHLLVSQPSDPINPWHPHDSSNENPPQNTRENIPPAESPQTKIHKDPVRQPSLNLTLTSKPTSILPGIHGSTPLKTTKSNPYPKYISEAESPNEEIGVQFDSPPRDNQKLRQAEEPRSKNVIQKSPASTPTKSRIIGEPLEMEGRRQPAAENGIVSVVPAGNGSSKIPLLSNLDMPRMGHNILHYLGLGELGVVLCHDGTEMDYWLQEEFSLDDSYKVHLVPIPAQIKYMIKPGGKCNAKRQHESLIRHHAIRHGLTVATKRQFRGILNQMCTFVPTLESLSFYQVMKCEKKRCSCPFYWMTWSNNEKRCKIREKQKCGMIKVLNATLDLETVFGCEEGTKCVMVRSERESNETNVLPPKRCRCPNGKSCGTIRKRPPNNDDPPYSSATFTRLSSAWAAFFFIFSFFYKEGRERT